MLSFLAMGVGICVAMRWNGFPLEIQNPTQIARLRSSFSSAIRGMGPEKAYSLLREGILQKPYGQQHAIVGLFGEVLYKDLGIEGLIWCDDAYGFGCYHGFFEKAITRKGIDILYDLDAACVSKFGLLGLGCPHGIGHGLGEYLGPGNLAQQLDYCKGLSWKGALFGCQSGVFMEYNFPSLALNGTSQIKTRPWDEAHAEAPCDHVDNQFRRACYFELTAWWQEVLSKNYAKIGVLCGDLTDAGEREACFMGVGYNVNLVTDFNPQYFIRVCHDMPQDGVVPCRAGASWAFTASIDHKKEAPILCSGMDTDMNIKCTQKSNLIDYYK